MTIGELRVRTTFNPSASSTIDQIKQKSAELIDVVYNLPEGDPSITAERDRLVRLAADCFEIGAMWAVKAATADAA